MKTTPAISITIAAVLRVSSASAQAAPIRDVNEIDPPATTTSSNTASIPGITVTPVAPTRAHLHLETDASGARIRIDGRDAGTDAIDIDLAPGDHAIDVTARGRAGYHTSVTLLAGENLSLAARLPRSTDHRLWTGIGIGIGASALVATTIAVVVLVLTGPADPARGTTGVTITGP